MLKQITSFVFLITFALQTFNREFIVLDYFANTGAYAKNCENKARIQLHCNGKCQMAKKLLEKEKQDQQHPDRKAENKNEVALSSKSFFPTLAPETIRLSPAPFYPLSLGREIRISRCIFHPPDAQS